MYETTIFDYMYPTYKITKPIRLISLFSGYDSGALAMKYLGVPYEHYMTCEWAVKSIQALNDLHFQDYKDYSSGIDIAEIKKYLLDKGISQNYNNPLNEQQIQKLTEATARKIYNNIHATHNLVNIQKAKGEDFNIVDKDKYVYMCTYSFPCQDLSLAGKGKGMKDTSTRSGMLWEVERILTELHNMDQLPQILLMENVPQVHSTDNTEPFNRFQLRLEELGYKNYWQDLIATDYGIPQTRNRCFMVSILGDYNYIFPQKQELKLKLKDLLEDNTDEKYYLSDKAVNGLTNQMNKDHKPNFIDIQEEPNKPFSTLTCGYMKQGHYETYLKIKNATSKGYLEATEGDGVDISGRMQFHRGTVQKEKSQTITHMGGEDVGVVVNNLRIRKLTPRECFRLMGVKDEDFNKIAQNQCDSSLYHLAGDSIVVDVLKAIINQFY